MIELPYDLPDADLIQPEDAPGRVSLFVPERVMVVIGKGSQIDKELNADAVMRDGVPVLRRATGGCAVVLSPEMVAVSMAVYTAQQLKSSEYFQLFNGVVLRALAAMGVQSLSHAGTSDIAIGSRKIAGTAIYRNRELVFYHAILNLAGSTDLMERYLSTPPRMPEYRRNRKHSEFVTSLAAEGYRIDVASLREHVEREFAAFLESVRSEA